MAWLSTLDWPAAVVITVIGSAVILGLYACFELVVTSFREIYSQPRRIEEATLKLELARANLEIKELDLRARRIKE